MLRKAVLTFGAMCALASIYGSHSYAAGGDIVLTAANAVDLHGHWSRAGDASAAGQAMLTSTDTGWQNTAGPAAAPQHYVDFTFTPQPNTAYRIWLRMRARNGSKYNDSVFVQFSNAYDKTRAVYRIGTTEGLTLNRQACASCALNQWGWYDSAYWLKQITTLTFTAGSQTLRVQTREDGVDIDQIVLSPVAYRLVAPGLADFDNTMVSGNIIPTSTPWGGTPLVLPAAIAVDAFDNGGPGVGYHDSTLNNSGSGRSTDVDLMPLPQGGYAVTGIDAGEWLNYTVSVPFAGQYVIETDVAATAAGATFHIDTNGTALTGVQAIPNTGDVNQFVTVSTPVALSSGVQTLKVIFDTKAASSSLGAIRIVRPRSTYLTQSLAIPGLIGAEQFDNGGQGLSWFDSTPGNAGGALRSTDVDIFATGNAYFVADTVSGEWLEYTVNVAKPGPYLARFDVAASVDAAAVSVKVGNSSSGSVMVPNTGSPTAWTTVTVTMQLEAGTQVMRLAIDAGGASVASVRFDPAPTFTTFNVPAGGSLQAAINAAKPGDVILLEPGATYVGNFTLPAKEGDEYITIRSAAPDALLPPEDVRITPAFSALLPKLRSPNGQPALATQPYAHHYRVQFVEFMANANGAGNIVSLGDGSSAQNTLAVVPHHLVFDRVYIHGHVTAGQKRGIALNSGDTTIINSYISEIKAVGMDSQAIGGWNGPGPYLISNNYLEAAGENVMFGGADPAIPNLVPSDITFTRNHLFKPLSWRGTSWTVKNLFELKSAQRVLIDGNLMENNWLAAQTGYAVLLKSVNQDGTAPHSVVQDVTFTNNVVRHVSSAINILGRDTRYPALVANNIVIRNNLFDDVSAAKYGGSGRFLQINGGVDITLEHNTVIADGATMVAADGVPTERFTFSNNVMPHNLYGIKGTGTAIGNGTISKYFPNGLFIGGIYIGAKASLYPVGNFFPATIDAVGFVDFVAGDYRLSAQCIYLGAASDGTDPGADFDKLQSVFAVAQ
jgi:hypothetical protein